MNNTQTVLFDMDGTITEPRQQIQTDTMHVIECLSSKANIGIVTGSPIEYIEEQLKPALDSWDASVLSKITFYPCNGTQKYIFQKEGYILSSSANMIDEIGDKNYQDILVKCLEFQQAIVQNYNLPYTGTFLQYRNSLLNWCPVGRDASDIERAAWINADSNFKIRDQFKELLSVFFKSNEIQATVALGGSTSFDIYPVGWDKTYVLRHVSQDTAWFLGDKCTEGGNDFELFKTLSRKNRAFSVASPSDTIIKVMNLMSDLVVVNA